MKSSTTYTCWVLTNHYAGIINQALGLAERVAAASPHPLMLAHKILRLRGLWHALSPYTLLGGRFACTRDSAPLSPPWPNLIIAAGRQAILPALWVKKQSQGFTRVVYLQDPRLRYRAFDLILCPYHDYIAHNLEGKNMPHILPITGATHRVTQDKIRASQNAMAHVYAQHPAPRISIMIGGPNSLYTMSEAWVYSLAEQLVTLHQRLGVHFLITCSRRTPTYVRDHLKSTLHKMMPGHFYLYEGAGENPYPGLLGAGDILMLTCDSVSMISEACSTTKPVYLIPLPQKLKGAGKFQIFYDRLMSMGRIQWMDALNTLNNPDAIPMATPLDDHEQAVQAVLGVMTRHT